MHVIYQDQNDPLKNRKFNQLWQHPLPSSPAQILLEQLRKDLGPIKAAEAFPKVWRDCGMRGLV